MRSIGNALLLLVVPWLFGLCAGCTPIMTKPGMTSESKAKDRYDCEQEAYKAAGGNGLYRDCMRARGYD